MVQLSKDGLLVDFHAISEAARSCLRNSPYRAIQNLSCEYDRGVLFLRGQVHCYYHKQLAQEAVVRLPGVSLVVNETEVV